MIASKPRKLVGFSRIKLGSAAYAARYVAKCLVAAGLAERAEVQLSYAIGVAKPVSILVESFGTSALANDALTALVQEHLSKNTLI